MVMDESKDELEKQFSKDIRKQYADNRFLTQEQIDEIIQKYYELLK